MSKKHIAIGLSALVLASSSSLYGATLDVKTFAKRVTITFTGVQSGVTLTNFPALVKLSTAIEGFSYYDFKGTNGADLRFADSAGNLIPHEVDTWNAAGVSTVWVKVPSLTQNATVTAYYGSTATLPEVAAEDVWANGYVGVWHLGESAVPMKDSSGGSTNFTQAVGSGILYASEGIVGGSVNFGSSGNSRALKAPDHPALDGFSQCTFEMWTFITDRTSGTSEDKKNKGMLSKRVGYNQGISYYIHDSGSATLLYLSSDGSSSKSFSSVKPAENEWTYQSYSFDGVAKIVQGWKDGASAGTDSTTLTSVFAGAADLYLGNFGIDGRNFAGKIDELRISNVARSSDWLKATYDTVKSDSFATYEAGDAPAYGVIDEFAFTRKVEVAFAGYSGAALENFPVLVKLSTSIDGFSYADFKVENGGDLRFTDSRGFILPHEIDTWNPGGVSTVWVKVPLLTPEAKITAYYGSSAALPAVPSRDVWDDGYVGVWHLGESALPMGESTGNSVGFTQTSSSSAGIAYNAAGVVGGAVDFAGAFGNERYLRALDHDNLDGFADFTIELWTFQDKFYSDSSYVGLYAKRNSSGNQESYFAYEDSSHRRPVVAYGGNGSNDQRVNHVAKTLPVLGAWTYQAFVRNQGARINDLFFDGTNNSHVASVNTSPGNVYAGSAPLMLGGGGGHKAFPGKIDEFRISRVARSADWIKATYATVTADSFATYAVSDAPGAAKIDKAAFSKKIEVLFAGYTGSELLNFPVLIKLSTDIIGFKYSDFSFQNGGDLRFADADDNIIPHEIDTWNESGVSTVWVKVPSLTPTTKIMAYYGSSNPHSVDPKDVWDANYVGVWHLGESKLPLKESTGVSTGFSSKTGTVVYAAAGVVGNSVDFSTSYTTKVNGLFANDDDDLDGFDDFTVEVWTYQNAFYTDSSKEQWAGILGKRAAAKSDEAFFVYQNSLKSMGNTLPKYCFNVDGTDGREMLTGPTLPVLGQWMHNVYTRNASTGAINVYFDGTNNVSATSGHNERMHASAAPLQLGWVAATYSTFPGKIDEVRISRSARSADWVKATHDTVTAPDFATYEVLSYEPDVQTPWYTNGVIACSVPEFWLKEGSSFEYAFDRSCHVLALTNLHLVAISQSGQTDYGYFAPGETREIVVASGSTLGLAAEVVNPSLIPSAEVSPSGADSEERDGAFTTYTFTSSGTVLVDKPGVVDIVIVGPNGGETVTLERIVINDGVSVVIGDTFASFGRYRVGAGTDESAAGSVTIRVWKDYFLSVDSVEASKATLSWGVTAISGTANIRLQYGPSKMVLTNTVMLAAGASAGAGGASYVTGLDPDTTYYAQLQVDGGSGYAPVGEVVSFTTESLLPGPTVGKELLIESPGIAGLNAWYIHKQNSLETATTDENFKLMDEPQMGIIAATNTVSTDKEDHDRYPPIWGKNRTWAFTGYMYFDGKSYYQFGAAIDDQVKVKIGNQTLFSGGNWQTWSAGRIKPTEGWHAVEFRFYNGGGGGGISGNWAKGSDQRTDRNGMDCGFGWGKSPTDTNPDNMKTLEWLCDPGDGSLLRAEKPKECRVSINGFDVDEWQYDIVVSNVSGVAVSGKLYYGESPDIDVLTNETLIAIGAAPPPETIELEAYETKPFHLTWDTDSNPPPYYVIVIPDVGVSEVMRVVASPIVAASVKSVGADSAVVTVAVGFDVDVDGDTPSTGLTAYFGAADHGQSESGWDHSQPLGTVETGTYDFTLSGLEVGRSYVLRIKAVDESGNAAWSAPVSFSVSGVYLGGNVEVYENDPRTQNIVLRRSGSASDLATGMTVFLEYSGLDASWVSALPGSVTFESGANVASIPFTAKDNTRKEGNRSFSVSIVEGSSYVAIAPLSATVTILDDESAEGEVVTWTGASGLDWANDGNWDKGHVPRSVDTARFADTGVTADMEVNVADAEGVRQLLIETPLAFGFSGAGSLAVSRMERVDTDGFEEGAVSVNVPVVVGNWENSYSVWKIEGSTGVKLNAGLLASNDIWFMKEGAGSLWLCGADTAYCGPWYIYEGTVYANAANSIRGSLNICTGNRPARLEALVDDAIGADSTPSVWSNGTFVAKESVNAALQPMRVNVYEGGVASLGEHFSGHQAHLTGGTITGQMVCYGASDQRIVSYASSETATFDCEYVVGAASNPLDITVADGAAPVDLVLGQRITYGADGLSGQYLTKFGTGTMRTTADWTGMSLGVEIAAGRVLVDNPSADGLGNQAVKVDAGASLGGTGFIGGTAASYETSSAITVKGQGNNEGRIEPGTIDDEGNHVIGTLTVGSAAKNGSVSFGDYTQLTVHIGPNGRCDRLLVNGTVSITQGVGTKIAIVCDDTSAVGGKYVVLRATGGLSGTFTNVVAPLPGWRVTYTPNEIAVEAPQPGRRVIIR